MRVVWPQLRGTWSAQQLEERDGHPTTTPGASEGARPFPPLDQAVFQDHERTDSWRLSCWVGGPLLSPSWKCRRQAERWTRAGVPGQGQPASGEWPRSIGQAEERGAHSAVAGRRVVKLPVLTALGKDSLVGVSGPAVFRQGVVHSSEVGTGLLCYLVRGVDLARWVRLL